MKPEIVNELKFSMKLPQKGKDMLKYFVMTLGMVSGLALGVSSVLV